MVKQVFSWPGAQQFKLLPLHCLERKWDISGTAIELFLSWFQPIKRHYIAGTSPNSQLLTSLEIGLPNINFVTSEMGERKFGLSNYVIVNDVQLTLDILWYHNWVNV